MSGSQPTVLVARQAMATRFEIALSGDDPVRLRAAGEEALNEVEALEDRLSLYRSTSEIARVNALAAREWVRVSSELFRLLQHAADLTRQTQGAFDITIGSLMRCWGFEGGPGALPDPSTLAAARDAVGIQWIQWDPAAHAVRFSRPGVRLDLGAIGKGFAIDTAVACLREAGVQSGLIHGGTSTAYGIGRQADGSPWTVGIEAPRRAGADRQPVAAVVLEDGALSVSAIWGKSFRSGDRTWGHIIDPRKGEPVHHTLLAAVASSSATETDALSTALLTLGREACGILRGGRSDFRAFVVSDGGLEDHHLTCYGFDEQSTRLL